MDILGACINTISLSGLEGCSLAELWYHLPSSCSRELVLDDTYKSYLWRLILDAVSQTTPPITILRTPEPRPPLPEDGEDYVYPHTFAPVEVDGVRGSCVDWDKRENVTSEIWREQLSLDQVLTRYGDRLVLVGGQEQREKALISPSSDPTILSSLTLKKYTILELIGACRSEGVGRTFVTKFLKCNARSTFHFTKGLQINGLIDIKVNRVMKDDRIQITHELFLRKFRPESSQSTYAKMDKKLFAIMLMTPFRALSLIGISQVLGFRNRRTIRNYLKDRVKGGYLEVVPIMSKLCEEYADRPDMKGSGYQLVQQHLPQDMAAEETGGDEEETEQREGQLEEMGLPEEAELQEEESVLKMEDDFGEDDEDVEADNWQGPKIPILREVPLVMQCYRIIEATGSEGINNTDFHKKFSSNSGRNRSSVKNLAVLGAVQCIADEKGKIRHTRIVAKRHFLQNTLYRQIQSEQNEITTYTSNKKAVQSSEQPSRPCSISTVRHPSTKLPCPTSFIESGAGDESMEVTGVNEDVRNAWADERINGEDGRNEDNQATDSDSIFAKIMMNRKTGKDAGTGSTSRGSWDLELSLSGMGYKKARRCHMMLKYVEERGVVSNLVDMYRHCLEQEHNDGHEEVMDRKTMARVLASLIKGGLLIKEQLSDNIGSSNSQTSLYYLPNVEWNKVEVARQERQHKVQIEERKKLDKLREKEKKVIKKIEMNEEVDKEDDVSEAEEDDLPLEFDMMEQKNKKRFQKLKLLHFYLWVLAHGYGNVTTTHGDGSTSCHTPDPQLLRLYPWMLSVDKIPELTTESPGWLSSADVLESMPLLLALHLLPIYNGMLKPAFPDKYVSYCSNTDKCLKKLYQVPRQLRDYFMIYRLYEFLNMLKSMKLIETSGAASSRNLLIHPLYDADILDTSDCAPRASFFLEEARSSFKTVPFHLDCLEDLEGYWVYLQYVCMNTRVCLPIARHLGKKKPNDDEWALPLNPNKDVREQVHLNELGFGAGGLPPMMFSHSKRNWLSGTVKNTEHYPKKSAKGWKRGYPREGSGSSSYGKMPHSLKGAVKEQCGGRNKEHYGPGDALQAIPSSLENKEDDSFEEGEVSMEEYDMEVDQITVGTALSSEAKPSTGVKPLSGPKPSGSHCNEEEEELERGTPSKRRKVLMPKSRIQSHSGGRGFPRRKVHFNVPSKADDNNEGSTTAGAITDGVTSGKSSSGNMKKGDLNDEDKAATTFNEEEETLQSGSRAAAVKSSSPASTKQLPYPSSIFASEETNEGKSSRSVWSDEEDKVISMYYLTGLLLHRFRGGSSGISFNFLRDHLKQLFPKRHSCNVSVVKRRMFKLARTRVSSTMVLLEDLLKELKRLDSAGPKLEFQPLFEFVNSQLSSEKPIGGSIDMLPQTISELYSKYDVIAPAMKPSIPTPSEEVLLFSELVMSIGSANFSTEMEKIRVFKLIERYPKEKIEEALNYLREKGVAKRTHKTDFSLNPFGSSIIRSNFQCLFESNISRKLSQEIETFNHSYENLRKKGEVVVKFEDAGVHVKENGGLVCETSCTGGSTIAVLDKVVLLEKMLVSCQSEVMILNVGKSINNSDLNENSRNEYSTSTKALSSMTEENQEQNQNIKELVPALREGTPSLISDGASALVQEFSHESTLESGREGRDLHDIDSENLSLKEVFQPFCRTDSGDTIGESMDVIDEELPDNQEMNKSRFKRVIDRGSLILEPATNCSELLGPLPELTRPLTPSSSNGSLSALSSLVLPDYPTLVKADSGPPTNRSLSSYLKLCRQIFSYTELECEYSSIVYEFIEQAGGSGIEKDQLKSIIEEYESGTTRIVQEEFGTCGNDFDGRPGNTEEMLDASQDSRGDFDATLISLINFEMVYEVGAAKEVLVSYKYVYDWLCQPPGGHLQIRFSPWMSFGSRDPDTTMLDKYTHAVHSFIVAHPGITRERLVDNLSIILTPCRLDNILLMLECEGKVVQHCVIGTTTSSLFSDSNSATTVVYYEAVLN